MEKEGKTGRSETPLTVETSRKTPLPSDICMRVLGGRPLAQFGLQTFFGTVVQGLQEKRRIESEKSKEDERLRLEKQAERDAKTAH